jgi:MYXO-CTERM domain-containing protein
MKTVHRLLPALFVVGMATSASAHISLDQASTHKSRYGEPQKAGPCGMAGGTRSENVYTYQAGETIQVEIKEYISHPGYFRIAFDDDGDDGFLDPQSIDPPFRDCLLDNPKDHCGESDFYNNKTVLMDELDVHDADYSGPKTYSWDVELPDVACDNCTLQIIQVMQDVAPIHAPYTPGEEDIYYQCIDLVLEKASTAGSGGGEAPPAADDGGCSVAGAPRSGNGGAFAVAAIAGVALLGRRHAAKRLRQAKDME